MTATKFTEFVEASDSKFAKISGKAQNIGALKPKWVDALINHGIEPATNVISVRDIDIRHTLRPSKSKSLPIDWYKNLPHHLEHPDAVLLDITHQGEPALLLIYKGSDIAHKLVVRLNYFVRKQGVMNIIGSGQNVILGGIRAMIGKGYILIEGSL